MSTQSPYLNAIILFPLITQVIGSSIAYVVFELDYYREGYFDSALFGFTKRCGYLRYQWKKILFLSFIIVFCYWSIGNLIIAPNTKYLTDRALFVLSGSIIMTIYTIIILPLLLPKSKCRK